MEASEPRIDMPGPGERLNSGEVKPARPAASVMVLRDGEGGPEVLLVLRNPEARFMGGAWVFPGGAVHADDADPAAAAARELGEEAGVTVEDASSLVPFSRWITPAEVEIRFDTFFYLVEAPAGAEGACDGEECVDLRWLSPAAALDAYQRDELLLVFPTIKHLQQLAEFESVSQALEHARMRKVQPVQPRVLIEGGVARVVLPGEPGYDD